MTKRTYYGCWRAYRAAISAKEMNKTPGEDMELKKTKDKLLGYLWKIVEYKEIDYDSVAMEQVIDFRKGVKAKKSLNQYASLVGAIKREEDVSEQVYQDSYIDIDIWRHLAGALAGAAGLYFLTTTIL